MPFHYKELFGYLERHKNYIPNLILDVCKILWWRMCGKRIAVITTGSGGVGDYLWIRNYMPLIRQQGYKVILVAMAHWKEIVESFDNDNVDIIRYFESCLSPKKIETIFFKLFKADIYFNFRTKSMANVVRYKCIYDDNALPQDLFYEEKNNIVFSYFHTLPQSFCHQLPVIPPVNDKIKRPFAVVTERGNTQGSLSIEQTSSIVQCLTDKGYNILFYGDIKRLASIVDNSILEMIIDGSSLSFPHYTYLIKESSLVITVNTSIYHFALQLNKPCVVISANEYETIKLDATNQEIVFNNELQKAYENNALSTYVRNDKIKLENIECDQIKAAIIRIVNILK